MAEDLRVKGSRSGTQIRNLHGITYGDLHLSGEYPQGRGVTEAGEAVVVEKEFMTGRIGRNMVRVREFGDSCRPWSEAVSAWGGSVDAIVCSTDQIRDVTQRQTKWKVMSMSGAWASLAHRHWEGILVGTVSSARWGHRFHQLLKRVNPTLALAAVHGCRTRSECELWLPKPPEPYHCRIVTVRHRDLGGATEAVWKVATYTRLDTLPGRKIPGLTKDGHYPRSLAMATDDTQAGPRNLGRMLIQTEQRAPPAPTKLFVWGTFEDEMHTEIADGRGLAWDFSRDAGPVPGRDYWVRVPSVFATEPVVRKLTRKEILSLWDYPVQELDQGAHPREIARKALEKTRGPPGKILRSVLYSALEQQLALVTETMVAAEPRPESQSSGVSSGTQCQARGWRIRSTLDS